MYLLLISFILICALLAIGLSNRLGIPSLLLFIGLGMATTALGLDFKNYQMAEKMASFALIIIMFYGGYGTNIKMAKAVLKESLLLSSLGTLLTAILSGLFAHYILGFPLLESFLLGSVISSTDYASVSSLLSSRNLNLKYQSASLLEVESGSNDPTAYTLTIILLQLLGGGSLSIPLLIAKQIAFGVLVGLGFSYLFSLSIERVDLRQNGLFIVYVFAIALGCFGLSDFLGGNGYLAVYILGIVMGNKEYKEKRETVFFFDGFTELMQIMLFYILGLLSSPEKLWQVLPYSFAIMAFISFVARPGVVFSLLAPLGAKKEQRKVISWAGIRGAAAIAFAILVINSKARLSLDIYHIVFGLCLLSSLVQGSLLPYIVKKNQMLDSKDSVLKTFNYYQDKSDLGFIQTRVSDSSLVGSKIKDLNLRFGFIVAKLKRKGQTLVPNGETRLQEGDLIVLGGESYFDPKGDELMEFTLGKHHPWINKKIVDIGLTRKELILMIQRENRILVPTGETILRQGDSLVYSREK